MEVGLPAERVALITGAAGGIGRAVVKRLAQDGFTVVATDVAPQADLEGAAEYRPADITDPAAIAALVEGVVAGHGRLDAVLAGAGVASQLQLLDVDPDEFDRMYDVNVKGAFFTVQAAVKAMQGNGGGRIVVISSLGAAVGGVFAGPHYVSSKAAVEGLVRSVARTGAPDGILVNALAPGVTDTQMTAEFGWKHEQFPLGRAGTPEDMAGAASYLFGPDASWVTGITLHVNGGVHFG